MSQYVCNIGHPPTACNNVILIVGNNLNCFTADIIALCIHSHLWTHCDDTVTMVATVTGRMVQGEHGLWGISAQVVALCLLSKLVMCMLAKRFYECLSSCIVNSWKLSVCWTESCWFAEQTCFSDHFSWVCYVLCPQGKQPCHASPCWNIRSKSPQSTGAVG